MSLSFYVKTVPYSKRPIAQLLVTMDSDTYNETPAVLTYPASIFPIYVQVTTTPAIAASTAAVVAACCSRVMDANRRITKRKQNVLAQANDINGAAVAAGITPAYTPP